MLIWSICRIRAKSSPRSFVIFLLLFWFGTAFSSRQKEEKTMKAALQAYIILNDRTAAVFKMPPICQQITLPIVSDKDLPETKIISQHYPPFEAKKLACFIRRVLEGNGPLATMAEARSRFLYVPIYRVLSLLLSSSIEFLSS
jgi:hypothetical protein